MKIHVYSGRNNVVFKPAHSEVSTILLREFINNLTCVEMQLKS